MIINILKTLYLRRDYDADLFVKVITTSWQIWNVRNENIFNGKIVAPTGVVAATATTLKSNIGLYRMQRRMPHYQNKINIL